MADLKTMADSLNVKMDYKKPQGKKRRSWLVEDNIPNEPVQKISTYKPINEIGSINRVDQSYLNESMNPIDQPYFSDGVDQPICYSLKNLRSNPLKLIQYFFDISNNNKQKHTPKITRSKIKIDLNISIDSVKTALKFLLKSKLIEIISSVRGKTGYSQYKLKDSIFNEIKEAYRIGSIKQIYSSSSNFNYKTTTTETGFIDPFEIDFEPLAEIGLTENHVDQLINQKKLTSEQIQECIHHFAFDLTHNDRAKTFKLSALDVFMGTLRKGSYYNAPSNYESQKALNLRLSLEAKMKHEQLEKELEDKLKEVERKKWSDGLTEQELLEFYVEDKPIDAAIPEKVKKTLKRRNALNNAQQYWESEIWPIKLKDILNAKEI